MFERGGSAALEHQVGVSGAAPAVGAAAEQAASGSRQVHGAGIVGAYSLPEAKRLVKRATEAAQQAEFPLRMSIAPHRS